MLTIHRYAIRQLLKHTSAAKCFQQQTWKLPVNVPHWNCFVEFTVCQKGVVNFLQNESYRGHAGILKGMDKMS